MPKFEELEAHSSCHVHSPSTPITPDPSNLIAKRYSILQRLGRGSFGTVYLVHDTRARDGEKLPAVPTDPLTHHTLAQHWHSKPPPCTEQDSSPHSQHT
ncbi:hypothetical protein J4Q44_G00393330 [Coregonus suidteri]|uniref:Uncharacterized protein n=1 Tax=Coregonus suidteri TaxID=861788 RepID=A0AAN8Q8K0_9TELE